MLQDKDIIAPLDYLGRCPHGTAVAWTSGEQTPKQIARCVGDLIRSGLTISQCTTEQARAALKRCPECKKKAKVKK